MSGKVRKYYIAAEEGDWSYAPGGDTVTYMLPSTMKEGMVMLEDNLATTTYKKTMYVEYEDEAFTKKVCILTHSLTHVFIIEATYVFRLLEV